MARPKPHYSQATGACTCGGSICVLMLLLWQSPVSSEMDGLPSCSAWAQAVAAGISANPTTIIVGGSSTLTWNTINRVSANLNAAPVALNGSMVVSPTTTTTYRITETNSTGATDGGQIAARVTGGWRYSGRQGRQTDCQDHCQSDLDYVRRQFYTDLVFEQCYRRHPEWHISCCERISSGLAHGDNDLYLYRQEFLRRDRHCEATLTVGSGGARPPALRPIRRRSVPAVALH
jgi:hypothetical protein